MSLIEVHESLPATQARKVVRWTFKHLRLAFVLRDIQIKVMRTDHWHHLGHFYLHKVGEFYGVLITARVPLTLGPAHDRGLRGGPPPIDPKDWREALLCAIAHEATHLRQFINGPQTEGYTRRKPGSEETIEVHGRIFSEKEAEWAEYRALQAWREEGNDVRD